MEIQEINIEEINRRLGYLSTKYPESGEIPQSVKQEQQLLVQMKGVLGHPHYNKVLEQYNKVHEKNIQAELISQEEQDAYEFPEKAFEGMDRLSEISLEGTSESELESKKVEKIPGVKISEKAFEGIDHLSEIRSEGTSESELESKKVEKIPGVEKLPEEAFEGIDHLSEIRSEGTSESELESKKVEKIPGVKISEKAFEGMDRLSEISLEGTSESELESKKLEKLLGVEKIPENAFEGIGHLSEIELEGTSENKPVNILDFSRIYKEYKGRTKIVLEHMRKFMLRREEKSKDKSGRNIEE